MGAKLISNVGINVMLFISFLVLAKAYEGGNAIQLLAAFAGFIMFVVLKIFFMLRIRRMQKKEQ